MVTHHLSGITRSIAAPAMIVWLAAVIGCQEDSSPTLQGRGRVMVQGEPLSGALVTFEPLTGTTGPGASVPVFGGVFELDPDSGLHGGVYRVRVAMLPPDILAGLPQEQRSGLPPAGSMIDPAYDENSRLQCELTPHADNELRFDVEFL